MKTTFRSWVVGILSVAVVAAAVCCCVIKPLQAAMKKSCAHCTPAPQEHHDCCLSKLSPGEWLGTIAWTPLSPSTAAVFFVVSLFAVVRRHSRLNLAYLSPPGRFSFPLPLRV